MQSILKNWTTQQATAFKEGTCIAQHQLDQNALFNDEALERLLESHPDAASMVYAMPTSETSEASFREGDMRQCSGSDVLGAVQRGSLWVQLLRLEDHHEPYESLKHDMLKELKKHVPGLIILRSKLSILISSPTIKVSYHADIPRNALWQIRGGKRLYLYPALDPYISRETMENIYLGQLQEAVPYSPALDKGAQTFDLEPGMLATWPVNAPHRIENCGELSVALVLEYFQPHSLIRYGVMYANGIFRKRFHRPLATDRHVGVVAACKAIIGFACKALKLSRSVERKRTLEFKVDPDASGGYREIEPRIRDY